MQGRQNVRHALVIGGCALLDYLLAGFILARLPVTHSPPGWLANGLSAANGLIAWFLLLNILASLLAAIPVALAIVWAIPRHRPLVALAVSTLTSSLVAAQVFNSELSPVQGDGHGYWVNFVDLTLAYLLAVPLAVAVVSALLRMRASVKVPPDR